MAAVEHKRQVPSGRPAVSLARKGLHKKDDGAARKPKGLGGFFGKTFKIPNVDAFDGMARKTCPVGEVSDVSSFKIPNVLGVPFWLSRRVPLKLPAAPLGCTLVVSMHSSC